MRLLNHEKISGVQLNGSVAEMRCVECEQAAIRLVLIAPEGKLDEPDELKRQIPLCKQHFIDACILFPELRLVEEEAHQHSCAARN